MLHFVCQPLRKKTHNSFASSSNMDFLRDLVTEQGCDDGSNSTRVNNPVNAVFNNMMGAQQNSQFAQEIGSDNLLNPTNTTTTMPNNAMPKLHATTTFSAHKDQMKVRNRSEMLARHLYGGLYQEYNFYNFF